MPRSVIAFNLHPFKTLKKILPTTLFGRILLILVLPVLFIQLTVVFVFVDRHLTKEIQLLAENIGNNVAFATEMLIQSPSPSERQILAKKIAHYFNLSTHIKPAFPVSKAKRSDYLWHERFLVDALQDRLPYSFGVSSYEDELTIEISTLKGNFFFTTQSKYLMTRTTYILLWWAILTPLLFLLIAIIFMRNQIRPLRQLALAVSLFGKGRLIKNFKPSGAYEVRKVALAFNAMKERIERQIKQRTEMLAGISHDLRTPLTRMGLELAMLEQTEEIRNLQEDVKGMRKMIEEYLSFAKGEEGEPPTLFDLKLLFKTILRPYATHNIDLTAPMSECLITARKNNLSRCFNNLIENAIRYAPQSWITIEPHLKKVRIFIDDNGPGIPEHHRKDVFQPFVRLEKSRNTNTGGTGLGLSIAQSIIHSHGGRIHLTQSPQGGLRVVIHLPV